MIVSTRPFEFILYVSDQDCSREFYSSLLNRIPVTDVPGMCESELNAGAVLGLMPAHGIARLIQPALPHPAQGSGIPRCELYVPVADADASYIHALKCGAIPVHEPANRDWGHRVAYAADPDGHVLAFAAVVVKEDIA